MEDRLSGADTHAASLARALAVVAEPFARITYTAAVDTLLAAVAEGRKFEFPVSWGEDLKSEHERYLAEVVFKKARRCRVYFLAPQHAAPCGADPLAC